MVAMAALSTMMRLVFLILFFLLLTIVIIVTLYRSRGIRERRGTGSSQCAVPIVVVASP